MMNTQATPVASAPRGRLHTLRSGAILPLGSSGGRLDILHGRVWLTRAGDLDDHVVERGETLTVPSSGDALVEAWDDGQPALVAWQPTPRGERIRSAFGRCWEIVDPVRRIGVGAVAALAALLAGALLFGPLSESRTRALLMPTVLHNSGGARTSIGLDAGTRTGSANHVSAAPRDPARIAAQQARRRAPGTA
jgi:DUF2917 family protein